MEPNDDLAELIGIMLGDGNLYVTDKSYQIRIAGHITDDKPYLLEWVKPLIQRIFDVRIHEKYVPKKNVMYLCINSKQVAEIIIKHGFPAGRKNKNNVEIPKWIFENKEFLKRCVRGLIDTDGFVHPVHKESRYPRIGFVSGIESLRNSFSKATKELNFKTTKWTLRMHGWSVRPVGQCTIGNPEDVIRYFKEIEFKNPKYIRDFNRFCKAPFV